MPRIWRRFMISVHQWWMLVHMAKENRINVRVGAGHGLVLAIAGVLTSEEVTVTASDVYRTLLAEAMAARAAACARSHVGPLRAGACGHCGRGLS